MFEAAVVITALLCGLVAGLLFAFAVVVMPGISNLPDREFIRAFQVMDRIIQNNQPLFMLAWVGSVVGLIASAGIGFARLDGVELGLLVAATAVYLVGVQLPTVAINIPLNNRLQGVDIARVSEQVLADERRKFEARWNRSNRARTVFSVLSTLLLLILLNQL